MHGEIQKYAALQILMFAMLCAEYTMILAAQY